MRHPFLDRDSLIVLADYVELETGTGAVHTAPGHGADDFETGARYGLPVINPVDAAGRFTEQAGPYAGMPIFDANARIIDDLRASGALVDAESYEHSYPHCWRCKNPVIFRATSQWFIGMDRNALRARAEEAVHGVRWLPEWGEARMAQMVGNHPEWCVSRQRVWGTPIPAVVCTSCNLSVLDPQLARAFAKAMRARTFDEGNASDLWWTEPLQAFAPPGLRCAACGGTSFEKERNIVDIWFESGVTWRAVLVERGMKFPADAYLEGGDQYRGWFRSNLLTSIATRDVAPYDWVISYGWVVDSNGHAMHKSTGNYIGADEGIEKYGADLLRLWTASSDVFVGDVRLGAKLLENVSNVYRNLRNRLRFLLGLLDDLPPDAIVPRERMEPLDRLAMAALDEFAREVVEKYRAFNLHDAYILIQDYDKDDLSAFYGDALKDRLYTAAPGSHRRRSAQSAMLQIFRTLCTLLAPVLSFTAEEAWQSLRADLRGDAESVFDLAVPARRGRRPERDRDVGVAEEAARAGCRERRHPRLPARRRHDGAERSVRSLRRARRQPARSARRLIAALARARRGRDRVRRRRARSGREVPALLEVSAARHGPGARDAVRPVRGDRARTRSASIVPLRNPGSPDAVRLQQYRHPNLACALRHDTPCRAARSQARRLRGSRHPHQRQHAKCALGIGCRQRARRQGHRVS